MTDYRTIDLMPSLREAALDNPDVVVRDDGEIELAPNTDKATVEGRLDGPEEYP